MLPAVAITHKPDSLTERSLFGFGNWVTTLGGLIMFMWDTQGISPWWLCHEGAHCIWDMIWSHVTKVAKIKMRLGLMDRLQVWRASQRLWSDGSRAGEAWARLGADGPRQRWRASEVKIDEPVRSHDDMKWIISFVIWLVHVLYQCRRRWSGLRKAKV
jgi:hypothetical protein